MTEIFFTKGYILIDAEYSTPETHKHWSKHLIFGLDDVINCTVQGKRVCCRGIAINSQIPHTVDLDGKRLLAFMIDETSRISELLEQKLLNGSDFKTIASDTAVAAVCEWGQTSLPAKTRASNILNLCGVDNRLQKDYDSRISEVLSFIADSDCIDEKMMSLLIKKTHLSQSRLSHLFSEQVGISISSYLLFSKLEKACQYVIQGENMTKAAVNAGFATPSHLTSTCKARFGLTPTTLRNSKFNFL